MTGLVLSEMLVVAQRKLSQEGQTIVLQIYIQMKYRTRIGAGYSVFMAQYYQTISSLKISHRIKNWSGITIQAVVSLGAWFTFPVFHNISILSLKALIIIIRCYFNTSNAINQVFMWVKQCDRILKNHVFSTANSFAAS